MYLENHHLATIRGTINSGKNRRWVLKLGHESWMKKGYYTLSKYLSKSKW